MSILITLTLVGCNVISNNKVISNPKEDIQQLSPDSEKQEYYNNYFTSNKVGFETLIYTKIGDYSVYTRKAENGNIKAEIQIDKTHKLTSYYANKSEYVKYENGNDIEWFRTNDTISFISLIATNNTTTSIKVDNIKKIDYISTNNGIDTVEIESAKDGKIILEIRESTEKIISMKNESMEFRFSDILENNENVAFTPPEHYTNRTANEIYDIINNVLNF